MVEKAYLLTGMESLQLSKESKLRFRKQLLYTGDFRKKKQRIPVSSKDLDHYSKSTNKMLSRGVKVPLPLEHTTNPKKNRGYLRRVERGVDKFGRDSIFGIIDFRDKKAAKLANSSDISVFIPPQQEDGFGRIYKRPISHVALTTQPVIHDLGGFEAIVASFDSFSQERKRKMKDLSSKKLAKRLGISLSKGEKLTAKMIKKHYDETKSEVDPIALSHMEKNRESQIRALSRIEDPKITPAVADRLVDIFCDDKVLSLSYGNEDLDDLFEEVLDALSENDIEDLSGESSGGQVIKLSKKSKIKGNPLLEDADSREEITA